MMSVRESERSFVSISAGQLFISAPAIACAIAHEKHLTFDRGFGIISIAR